MAVRSYLLGEQHEIACYAYLGPFRAARPGSTQHGSCFGSSGANIEATRWSARSTQAATNSLQADQRVINKPMSWQSVCGLTAPQCLNSPACRQREQPSLRGGPSAVPSRLYALHSTGTLQPASSMLQSSPTPKKGNSSSFRNRQQPASQLVPTVLAGSEGPRPFRSQLVPRVLAASEGLP